MFLRKKSQLNFNKKNFTNIMLKNVILNYISCINHTFYNIKLYSLYKQRDRMALFHAWYLEFFLN